MKKNEFLHQRIYIDLVSKIKNGTYSPGTKLPTEAELCEIYNVSRHTIRKSLEQLDQNGYIMKKSGSGTFIKYMKTDYTLSTLKSFSELSLLDNELAKSIILQVKKITPDKEIKKQLELRDSDMVYYVERIRLSGEQVMCFECTYIPANLCPNLEEKITPFTSLYDLYENVYNLEMDYGKINLEAINADKKTSEILGINLHDPLLVMRCTVYLTDKRPLYYVIAKYIGEKYNFTAILPRKIDFQ